MSTIGRSVGVTFGYLTRAIEDIYFNEEGLAADPGVSIGTGSSVERALTQLGRSLHEPPLLPEWGEFNPAPLRIRAWPDPIVCGQIQEWDNRRSAQAQRRVSGGRWWPLGIGDEAWNSDHRGVQLDCGPELGPHTNTLETHEIGPDPASAETTVTHYAAPVIGDVETLSAYSSGWYTSYCEPGGARTITWSVHGGTGPYHAQVNGVEAEMRYRADEASGDGWFEVACVDRLGLQAMTVVVWDSADQPNRVVFPVLLMAVGQHPSGRPWSDFE